MAAIPGMGIPEQLKVAMEQEQSGRKPVHQHTPRLGSWLSCDLSSSRDLSSRLTGCHLVM